MKGKAGKISGREVGEIERERSVWPSYILHRGFTRKRHKQIAAYHLVERQKAKNHHNFKFEKKINIETLN